MAGLNATAGGGFDYIQSAEPADPEKGELWYDTDGGTDGNGEVKVYDGAVWDATGYVSHDQLTNVSPGDHFSPGSGLTFSAGTLALLLSDYLTIDGNGDLALASGSVGQDRLAFDTATQSELDSHAGDSTAHHSKPSGTQSGGYSDARYTKEVNTTDTRPVRTHVSEVYGEAKYITFWFADGTTVQPDSNWVTKEGFLIRISVNDSYRELGYRPVVPSHSHNI